MIPSFQIPRLRRLALVFVFAFATSHAASLQAAPKARLWERWLAHDPDAGLSVDHGRWQTWLDRFVRPAADGINRVAYGEVDAAANGDLDKYIDSLAALPISRYSRDEQRAYWINLYNALTVQVVLAHYPLDSIRDVSSGLFSSGPWGLELVRVEGEDLSLDDIEHRILRPIWRDPRIHYAVNCASLGCPNLQTRAFDANNTERLLDRGARDFVNHPRGARIVDGRLVVSSIYDWFASDFGGSDAAIIAHLRAYAAPTLAAALADIERIADDDYDWRLNAAIDR